MCRSLNKTVGLSFSYIAEDERAFAYQEEATMCGGHMIVLIFFLFLLTPGNFSFCTKSIEEVGSVKKSVIACLHFERITFLL